MNEQSGENKSKTLSEILRISREKLQEWEDSIGLPKMQNEIEALKYLEMGYDLRSKLSSQECEEASFCLNKYAMYIARLAQREESESILLNNQINQVICDRVEQQQSYHYENKKALAIKENDNARKLNQEKIAADVKAKRLSYLSMRIEKIADSFHNLSVSKNRKI